MRAVNHQSLREHHSLIIVSSLRQVTAIILMVKLLIMVKQLELWCLLLLNGYKVDIMSHLNSRCSTSLTQHRTTLEDSIRNHLSFKATHFNFWVKDNKCILNKWDISTEEDINICQFFNSLNTFTQIISLLLQLLTKWVNS